MVTAASPLVSGVTDIHEYMGVGQKHGNYEALEGFGALFISDAAMRPSGTGTRLVRLPLDHRMGSQSASCAERGYGDSKLHIESSGIWVE